MKLIKFISNSKWIGADSEFAPTPSSKVIPKWYQKANKYLYNEGKPVLMPSGDMAPTFKTCPALLDAFISGYTLVTPCDIEFYFDNSLNRISAKVLDERHKYFCTPRPSMPDFIVPDGYDPEHFTWLPGWAIELPSGYSALYLTPMNRYDLPFQTVQGVIDNDLASMPGQIPVFFKKGWTGILPAGTPYVQIFPFKREDWQHEIIIEDPEIIKQKKKENREKYNIPGGGFYRNFVWQKRKYI